MGWFSDAGRSINRGFNNAVNNISNTIRNPGQIASDPLGTLGNFAVASRGGLPGQVGYHSDEGQALKDKSVESAQHMYNRIRDNPATSYVVGQAGGVPGLLGLDAVEKMMEAEEPPMPTEDERLKKIRREMSDDATDFRSNLESFKNRKKQGLLSEYSDAKEEGVRRTRENYGRRGLLYSGLASEGEAEIKGQIQGQYNEAKAGINQEAEQIADAKERAAAAVGIDQAQQLLGQAEQYYNMSAQNDLARRRAFGNLASGLGYGLGSIAGAGKQPNGLIAQQPQMVTMNDNPQLYGGGYVNS